MKKLTFKARVYILVGFIALLLIGFAAMLAIHMPTICFILIALFAMQGFVCFLDVIVKWLDPPQP